jgi:hypothetical protein
MNLNALKNNIMYTISEDQNTVTLDADGSNHKFSEAPHDMDDACFVCSLQKPCIKTAGRNGNPDFPFPCLDSNRKDNRNGYFISNDG